MYVERTKKVLAEKIWYIRHDCDLWEYDKGPNAVALPRRALSAPEVNEANRIADSSIVCTSNKS
jgi:hypothetical protein